MYYINGCIQKTHWLQLQNYIVIVHDKKNIDNSYILCKIFKKSYHLTKTKNS